MSLDPTETAINRVSEKLSSLAIAPAKEMDLRLDLNDLQLPKISEEAVSALASIIVFPGGKKGKYRAFTNEKTS